MVVRLIERLNDYVIMVNSYPYLEREVMDKKNGIIRVYGLDGDLKKINYVVYPKSNYTRQYIEDNVLHQYETCPLCNIGVEVDAEKRIPYEPKISVNKKISYQKKGLIATIIVGLSIIPIGILLLRRIKRQET